MLASILVWHIFSNVQASVVISYLIVFTYWLVFLSSSQLFCFVESIYISLLCLLPLPLSVPAQIHSRIFEYIQISFLEQNVLEKQVFWLERMQKSITRICLEMECLSYKDKPRLLSLRWRRLRGSLIEIYKIVRHINKVSGQSFSKSREVWNLRA